MNITAFVTNQLPTILSTHDLKDDSFGVAGMMPCPVQMRKYSLNYQLSANKYINEPIQSLYWKMNNTFPGASAVRVNYPSKENMTFIKGINLT